MYIQSKGGNSKINFPHLHNTDIHMVSEQYLQILLSRGRFPQAYSFGQDS